MFCILCASWFFLLLVRVVAHGLFCVAWFVSATRGFISVALYLVSGGFCFSPRIFSCVLRVFQFRWDCFPIPFPDSCGFVRPKNRFSELVRSDFLVFVHSDVSFGPVCFWQIPLYGSRVFVGWFDRHSGVISLKQDTLDVEKAIVIV